MSGSLVPKCKAYCSPKLHSLLCIWRHVLSVWARPIRPGVWPVLNVGQCPAAVPGPDPSLPSPPGFEEEGRMWRGGVIPKRPQVPIRSRLTALLSNDDRCPAPRALCEPQGLEALGRREWGRQSSRRFSWTRSRTEGREDGCVCPLQQRRRHSGTFRAPVDRYRYSLARHVHRSSRAGWPYFWARCAPVQRPPPGGAGGGGGLGT